MISALSHLLLAIAAAMPLVASLWRDLNRFGVEMMALAIELEEY